MRKNTRSYWKKAAQLEKLTEWAADGLSMKQIAGLMGISRSTLYVWCECEKDISDALARGHTRACEEVENALFKRCVGYTVSEKKIFKVRRKKYEGGKVTEEYDELTEGYEERYIAPDTAAQKFFLVNNMPEKYRISPKEKEDGEDTGGVVELPPVAQEVIEVSAEEGALAADDAGE